MPTERTGPRIRKVTEIRAQVEAKRVRQPMTVTIALSAEQLKSAGIPEWMTADDVSECLDNALLSDDSVLRAEVEDFVYARETEQLLTT